MPALKTGHRASSLASGTHGFCALTAAGDVVCNGHSQYPYGPITGVKAVSAGPHVLCTIKSGGADDGKVECTGVNQYNAATPATAATFSDLSGTMHWLHNCGILDGQGSQTAGQLRCWGWDQHNQRTVPTELANATFSAVGAGYLHTCGILDDQNGDEAGRMKCWGGANVGQTEVPKDAPWGTHHAALVYEYTWSSLGMGFFHSCGVLKGTGNPDSRVNPAGRIKCWGWDRYSQSHPARGAGRDRLHRSVRRPLAHLRHHHGRLPPLLGRSGRHFR